jgi:phage antirepressor YoqD-like protein
MISIEDIINKGESLERSFFEWMRDNKYVWHTQNDLNKIWLLDKSNFKQIQQHWPEIKKL